MPASFALDLALDGDGPAPPEWLLSRVCEEFGLPLVAGGAVDQPLELALSIMEMRAYARTKEAVERAEKPEDVPDSPMVEMVFAVQYEALRRRNATQEG